MKHYYTFALVLVLALTIASGAIQGHLANRWGFNEQVQVVADRMAEMPTSFGAWERVSQSELDESAERMLEPFCYRAGIYKNNNTDARVSASLLLGPPGTVAVHTPEVCFSSRNYTQLGSREEFSVANPKDSEAPHTFWKALFKRSDADGYLVPAYFAWTTGDAWSASNDARGESIGAEYLYKIQVTCALPPSVLMPETDPCQDFLKDFVPTATPYLVPPEKH